MRTSNYGDPYTHRLTLRITDRQFEWLCQVSELMGVTPSDYLRMVINTACVSTKNSVARMRSGNVGMLDERNGENVYENVKTDSDDIV